jgi:site-specific DNA-methyltransferase (adenine-specific)
MTIVDRTVMGEHFLDVNRLYHGDVLEGLMRVRECSIDLIFTSPPYNVNTGYGNHIDSKAWDEYLAWLFNVWTQCERVLKVGGRLVVNIDSIINRTVAPAERSEYFRPIYADLINQMRRLEAMKFRSDICWFKHQVAGRAAAWGSYLSPSNPIIRRNHEYLLVWSKNNWSAAADGRKSDLTASEFQEFTMSTWHIKAETRYMGGHPAPFPEELARRVIKLYSYLGDTVLDPFCGSGTTPYVAAMLGRNYIGIDNCRRYLEFAAERLLEKPIPGVV